MNRELRNLQLGDSGNTRGRRSRGRGGGRGSRSRGRGARSRNEVERVDGSEMNLEARGLQIDELREMNARLEQEVAATNARLEQEIAENRSRSRSRSNVIRTNRPGFKEAIRSKFTFSGDGEADYDDWREQVELSVFTVYEMTEEEKVMYLTANLEGQARRFVLSGRPNGGTFKRLVDFDRIMKEGFEGRIDWHSKFFGCKQQPNEKIRIYVNKLQVLGRKMFPNAAKEDIDKLCLNQIKQHALQEHKLVLKYIKLNQPLEEIIDQLITNENLEDVSKARKRKENEMLNNIETDQELNGKGKVEIPEQGAVKRMREEFNNTTKQMKYSFK
jgi:hypothetical protein